MKKSLLLFLGIVFTAMLFAQERVNIRLNNPQPEDLKHFFLNNYDVASVRPGEYLDLVVTYDEFNRLVSEGFGFEVFQTEAEMAANLAPVDNLPGYRTYAATLAELQQTVINYPDICKLYNLGESRGKQYFNAGNNNYVNYQHDIWALKVSSNVQVYEDKPAVYYMGAHHAREPLSTEVTFYVLNHLLQNYGTDPEITHSINTKEIWFVPIVNPDGHKIVLDQINLNWRKNIRDNDGNGQITPGGGWSFPDGVDPNRNYGWEFGGQGASANPNDQTYRGPGAFSEPELEAMRDLMAYRHFVAGISYHTYSELVLWPFGYASNITAPDNTAIAALGTAMGQAIPKLSGSGHYDPGPSWSLYPAAGNTDDYAYGQHGIFSYTIELATQFIPPPAQVIQVCQDNLEAALILLNRIDKSTLTGHVTNSVTGQPIIAEVYVHGIDNTGEYREPYQSNEDFGRYFRMLPNGNYSVTFSSFGYISQTIDNVNINNLGQTVLDVSLVQSQIISVSGTVTDIDTGAPIENASIQVMGTPLDPVYTNTAGQYVIDEIFENTYTFRVFAMDYITVMQEVMISPENNVVNFQLVEANAESFETGVFSEGWTFAGNQPWFIDNTTAWDGMYSARSGAITHNQSSSMIYTMEADSDGEISFYRKVSSEANYDFLRFYINDELKGQWSGNLDWEEVSFNVMPGINTFRWTYIKDGSVSGGSDCGWIDFIIFPLPASCSAPVNLTATSVTSNSAQLNWMAGGAETMWDLVWGTSGFNPSTQGTLVEGLNEAVYLLSGLEGITDYEFYVRGYCDDNQTSGWGGPGEFTTLCDIFTLPYSEPFGTAAVSCWIFPQGQGNWNFGNSYTPPSSVSGSPNAFFNWSPSQTNYSYSLTSPLMDATNMSVVKLDFILFINNYSASTVENMSVEFKALDDEDWVLLESFSTAGLGNNNAEHIRTNEVLEGMGGKMFQVRFRAHGPNSFNINGWGLDDIHVHGEGSEILPGDSNCDGIVNVLDVITTVNYIMGNNPEPFCFDNADVTSDGLINVLDIIGTVNIVIGGGKTAAIEVISSPAHLYINSYGIDLYSDGTLAGLQFEMYGLVQSKLSLQLDGFEFISTVKDGKMLGLIFSFDNTPVPAGKINLFSFTTEEPNLAWGSVVAGNIKAEEVDMVLHDKKESILLTEEFNLSVYPNPSQGKFIVGIDLPVISNAGIRIIDLMGKETLVLQDGILQKGNHNFEVIEADNLPTGIYFIQLHAVTEDDSGSVITRNQKMIITR